MVNTHRECGKFDNDTFHYTENTPEQNCIDVGIQQEKPEGKLNYTEILYNLQCMLPVFSVLTLLSIICVTITHGCLGQSTYMCIKCVC